MWHKHYPVVDVSHITVFISELINCIMTSAKLWEFPTNRLFVYVVFLQTAFIHVVMKSQLHAGCVGRPWLGSTHLTVLTPADHNDGFEFYPHKNTTYMEFKDNEV